MLVWLILLAAVAVIVVIVGDVHLSTRRLVRHLRDADLRLGPVDRPLHDAGEAAIAALEAAGYELEACGTSATPVQAARAVCLLRSPTGDSIAEVGVADGGAGERVTVALESWIPGGRLATQSAQGLVTPPGDLKQVFPGVTVAELLHEHERALAALEAAGRPAIRFPAGEAEGRWTAALRHDAERHPSGLGVSLRALRIIRGHVEDEGSVIDRGLI